MDKNANIPNPQNLSPLKGIEDIPLSFSEVIKKPQVIQMIPEERKGFLKSLGEKLNRVSNLFSFFWKEEKPLKTLKIEPQMAYFKSPRNKNNFLRTLGPVGQAVNDMENDIHRTNSREPEEMKVSNSNMIRYYRNMHNTKSRLMKKTEGDFPVVDCKIKPKPVYIRQDLIHAKKTVEMLTPERFRNNNPIRPMKEILQEKKRIAKGKQVQKKKLDAKVEIRKKKQQQKERMRISNYFIDNSSPPHSQREMTESDKEEEEAIMDQPTKKIFGNDKTILKVTSPQIQQQKDLVQSPKLQENLDENFGEYKGFESIVQEKKPEETTQKTDLRNIFFATRRIAYPFMDENDSENDVIKPEPKLENRNRDLFQVEEPQQILKEIVEPSPFQGGGGRRMVPSSFKLKTAELDEKPKLNIHPPNEFNFFKPLRSESNRTEVPNFSNREGEIKDIKVKEITAQFLSDHLSDSTNLSSKSKDNQDQILAEQQQQPKLSFFKFQRDFRFSKF